MFGKHSLSKTKKKKNYLHFLPSMDSIICLCKGNGKNHYYSTSPLTFLSFILFFFPLRHEKSLLILDPGVLKNYDGILERWKLPNPPLRKVVSDFFLILHTPFLFFTAGGNTTFGYCAHTGKSFH